jgi:hypothetical protein
MSGQQPGFPYTAIPQMRELLDIYANQARIGATLSDFTIVFGLTEDAGNGQISNRDRVAIRLAPGTAKLLHLHLEAVIGAYEQAVGTISVPDRLVSELRTMKDGMAAGYTEQMKGSVGTTLTEKKG